MIPKFVNVVRSTQSEISSLSDSPTSILSEKFLETALQGAGCIPPHTLQIMKKNQNNTFSFPRKKYQR